MNPTKQQTKPQEPSEQTLYAYEAYTKYTAEHYHGIIKADNKEEAEAAIKEHIDKNHGPKIKWVRVTRIQFDKINNTEIYEICDYQDE